MSSAFHSAKRRSRSMRAASLARILAKQTEEVFARADGQCGADGAVIATDELSYAASSEIRIAVVALFLQEFEHPDVNVGRTVGTEVVEIGLRGGLVDRCRGVRRSW